MNIMKSTTVQT